MMADDDDVKQVDAAAGDADDAAAAAGEGDDAPGGKAGDDAPATEEAVYEVPVEVTAVLGTATMKVSQLLKLGRGAVVQLDRMVGESIELHANNRLIARGDVVVIDDRLGVTMTEIIKSDRG